MEDRLGGRSGTRELVAEAVEQPGRVGPETSLEVSEGRRHGTGPAVRLVAPMRRWPISWSSPSAPISPAWIEAVPAVLARFIRLASWRIPAVSVVTTSPRVPISGRSTAYRRRGSRRTWNARRSSRIGQSWHGGTTVIESPRAGPERSTTLGMDPTMVRTSRPRCMLFG